MFRNKIIIIIATTISIIISGMEEEFCTASTSLCRKWVERLIYLGVSLPIFESIYRIIRIYL